MFNRFSAFFVGILALVATDAWALDNSLMEDRILGNPDAAITIYDHSSLTCPHCAEFHNKTLPQIKKEWIDTGKARLIFRDFPFDKAALHASMLARCINRDRYYPFLDILFQTQANWARAKDPIAALDTTAKLAGMSKEQIHQCTSDQKFADAIIMQRIQAGKTYNIESTPTFVLKSDKGEKKISGALPYGDFESALKALAK